MSVAPDFAWDLTDGVLTISGNGDMPNYNDRNPPWYSSRDNISSVLISDGITGIGHCAFSYYTSLTDITIPESVTSIGDSAFSNCSSLANILIPESVTSIGESVFYGCTSIISAGSLGSGCDYEFGWTTNIPNSAFRGCTSLASIILPDNVTYIGDSSFYGCTSITSITIPESVTSILRYAFYGCSSISEIIWNAKNVSDIGYNAIFRDAGLSTGIKVMLGNDVVRIPTYAFSGLSIKEIYIHEKLEAIGENAFSGCPEMSVFYYGSRDEWYEVDRNNTGLYLNRLKCNYVPTTNENGYDYYVKDQRAFITYYNEPLSSGVLQIPSSLGGYPVKTIEEYAITRNIQVDEIIIPEGIEILELGAFGEARAKKYVVPSTVTQIASGVFGGFNIEEFSVSESNPSYCDVDGNLYTKDKTVLIKYSCGKTNTTCTLPAEVKTIGIDAFFLCSSIENVILGENVETISNYAFYNCSNLKSITIPASVTSIGASAFGSLGELKNIYYSGTKERWNTIDISINNDSLSSTTIQYGTIEPDPVSIQSQTIDGEREYFNFNVHLCGIDAGKTVYIAYYNNNKLVYCNSAIYDGSNDVVFRRYYSSGIIDCVKAMIWEDSKGMVPVCDPAVKNIAVD